MKETIVTNRKYGKEFEDCVQDILIHPYFKSLDAFRHHGIKRTDHSIRVAYNAYVIGKKLNLDARSIARGGLLHDFFFDLPLEEKRRRRKEEKGIKKVTKMQGFTHPKSAQENAKRFFDINELESDIIAKHMFPLTIKPPKYSESWIVNGVDTSIALKELFYAFCRHPFLSVTGRMNQLEGYKY